MTKALKRLEAKDLVEIVPSEKNKSKNIVKITEKGKIVTEEFINMIGKIENEIFKDYSEDELFKLKITLRDLSKEFLEL